MHFIQIKIEFDGVVSYGKKSFALLIAGQREAFPVGRQLHDHQRAVQLLLHVGNASEDPREAVGEEGRKKLRTSGQQETCLLPVSRSLS